MTGTTPSGWPYVTATDPPLDYPAVSLDLATKLEAHGPHGGGGAADHGDLTGLSDPDHPITAVTGLQAALDGKAPTSHTHALGDLPSTLATDTEVAAAITAHQGAADPHPVYLTTAEGNAAYEPVGAVAAHASLADPHTGYLKPTEVLAGTSITVDTTTTPGSVIINGAAGGGGGSTILNGAGPPAAGLGATGNYYLDETNDALYGPKVVGSGGGFGPAQSVYTNQTPQNPGGFATAYAFGHDVTVAAAGRITGLRFWRDTSPSTSHTMRLWSNTSVLLATSTTTGESGTGWKTATLGTPVTVAAGATVRVVIENNPDAADRIGQNNVPGANITNGDLTLNSASNYGTPGTYPTTAGTSKYWVDVIFEAGTPAVDPWPVALKSVPPGGTTGQVLAKTSAVDYAAAWGNPTPGRNRIINGDMSVNQRGFTSMGPGGPTYTVDRWVGVLSAGSNTISAVSATPGELPESAARYLRVVSAGQNAATGYSALWHPVESVRTLSGKTATLSFWAKAASGTPSIGVSYDQVFGAGGSATTAGVHAGKAQLSTTWARYSITFAFPSLTGKTVGTNDQWLFKFWTSAGTDWNAPAGSIGVQSNTVDLWGVQLEESQSATPFDQKPYAAELRDCQRYFVRESFPMLDSPAPIPGISYSTVQALCSYRYPAMRAAPTIQAAGAWELISNGGVVAATGTPTFVTPTTTTATVSVTVAGGLVVGQGVLLRTDNGWIDLTAEL